MCNHPDPGHRPCLTAEEIDLASYLQRVEQHNKSLEIARSGVAQTEKMKDQAMAGLFPNAGLQVGYTRNLNQILQPGRPMPRHRPCRDLPDHLHRAGGNL